MKEVNDVLSMNPSILKCLVEAKSLIRMTQDGQIRNVCTEMDCPTQSERITSKQRRHCGIMLKRLTFN